MKRKIKQYKMEIRKLNDLYVKNMNNIIKDIDNYFLLYENINKSIYNLKNYDVNILDYIIKNKTFIKDIEAFLNSNIKFFII